MMARLGYLLRVAAVTAGYLLAGLAVVAAALLAIMQYAPADTDTCVFYRNTIAGLVAILAGIIYNKMAGRLLDRFWPEPEDEESEG